MPLTRGTAIPQTPSPGCGPKPCLERSLEALTQRLCGVTTAPSAHEANAVVAVVTDVLLQSFGATERELILALSCTAMLVTRQVADAAVSTTPGNVFYAAKGARGRPVLASADVSRAAPLSSSPLPHGVGAPSTSGPAVLPLLPLLAAVAARDEAAAEMALRRLNRRLGRPLSIAAPIPAASGVCASTGESTIRSTRTRSSSGDGQGGSRGFFASGYEDTTLTSLYSLPLGPEEDGELRCSVGGKGGGWRGKQEGAMMGCAAAAPPVTTATPQSAHYRSSCCLSLLAAQEAEARLVMEAERCKAAAVRLCGRCARSGGAAAEAESVRGACVAVLAAAAADVRCHQELLGSPALKALSRLLRSTATAPYAAVLVHNLALPTSVCFRDQLRRRGVLPPLFDYLSHLTPPPSAPPRHHHQQQQQQQRQGLDLDLDLAEGTVTAVDLTGLTVVLGAIACLCAGREGVEALRQPHLDAMKRLGALWEGLGAVARPGRCSTGPQSVGLTGGCGSGSGSSRDSGSSEGDALLTVYHLLNGLLDCLLVDVPLEPSGCGRAAPERGLEVGALRAERAEVGRGRGDQRGGGSTAASAGLTDVGFGEEASASCLSFESQVLVDGRPMQLVTTITRTTRRRPDGTEDVHYQLLDQVSPDPAQVGVWRPQLKEEPWSREQLRTEATVPPRRMGRNPAYPPPTCCQSSSFWLRKAPPTVHRSGQSGPVHLHDNNRRADATIWPPESGQHAGVGPTCNSAVATAAKRLSFGPSSASPGPLEPRGPQPSPQLTHLAGLAKQAGTYLFETPLGRIKRTSLP